MNWIGKAQERLIKKAGELFAIWCQTKAGSNWRNHWSRKPSKLNRRAHLVLAQNSPYAHGFSLPEYHHDLIAAVGRGDEEMAKGIMLEHYI